LALALVSLQPRTSEADGLHLAIPGVLGDAIALGPPEQAHTVILFFMSRRAQDECATFGREIDERTLDADVESVAIVDVHRYGGLMRSLALSRLRQSAQASLARRRSRRQARGIDLSNGAANRWHLVGDFDGSLFSRFNVAPDPQHPIAFVLDRRGALHGPYSDSKAVVAAVDEATRVATRD
jgi:hypothetical protein